MTRLILIALGVLALILSEHASAQEGFLQQPSPDLSLAPSGHAEHNFPAIQTSVVADQVLDLKTFEFLHGLLASGRRSEKLNCRVEVRAIKENRRFSTGSQWVEYLDIELFTDHFGPRSVKFSFPLGVKMGRRIVNNQDYGPVEEIRIESPEPYENWFQIQHDGKRLVWAEIGGMYQFAPCLLKK